jgi:hypothetical protein
MRNERHFNANAFKEDFSSLPLNIVYGLGSSDDMVDVMNSFIDIKE